MGGRYLDTKRNQMNEIEENAFSLVCLIVFFFFETFEMSKLLKKKCVSTKKKYKQINIVHSMVYGLHFGEIDRLMRSLSCLSSRRACIAFSLPSVARVGLRSGCS